MTKILKVGYTEQSDCIKQNFMQTRNCGKLSAVSCRMPHLSQLETGRRTGEANRQRTWKESVQPPHQLVGDGVFSVVTARASAEWKL